MPQIQRAAISGCCVGTYYYDLGGAHSRYRSKNIDEFAMRILDIGMNKINIAVTNTQQGPERAYLEQLGFKEVFTGPDGMHVHCVDSKVLGEALQKYREIKEKKIREEQERRRQEEIKRREALEKKVAAERAKKAELEKKELESIPTLDLLEDVTITWVRQQYTKYPNVSVQGLFNKLFGFKKMPNYERKWDDDDIVRSINSRLRRRREIAAGKAAK